MPDTVNSAIELSDARAVSGETWAVLAGQGLGQLDKAAGAFDDTPPTEVSAEHTAAYRAAYYLANPDYALE